MSTTEIATIEQQATGLVGQAEAIVVRDQATLDEAASMSRSVAAYIKRVGEVLDPICEATHRAWKVALGQRADLLKPADAAKHLLGRRMAAYEQEVENRRREAERIAQRERERLEAAERARVLAEQRRLQEEEDQRALDAAAAAEAAGDTVLAERLIAEPVVVEAPAPMPVFVPPPAVTLAAPKAEGISFRDNWSAQVVDLAALVKAVASGSQPLALVLPNQVGLNGLARSLKSGLAVPGVRAVNDRIAATKA